MLFSNILLLGSKSKSRQKLLNEAGIQFKLISQHANEMQFSWDLPLENLLKKIAVLKMENVVLPIPQKNNDRCFVLAADTMGINSENEICGKPKNIDDAIKMIKSYREGATTGTAFCIDRKISNNGIWQLDERIIECVTSKYIFDVPDNWIERYFELSLASGINFLEVSGAVAVEEFGTQFLKYINGSFSTIVGLPMFEVREALYKLMFF